MVTEAKSEIERRSPTSARTPGRVDFRQDGAPGEEESDRGRAGRRRYLKTGSMPLWSLIASVLLVIAVWLLPDGAISKYLLLVGAQLCYLLSVLTR